MRYDLFSMLPERAFQKIGRKLTTLEGGDKGSAPPPVDYGPMAKASLEAAKIGADLGGKQLTESQRQYVENMKVAKPVVDAQLKMMEQQQAQGADQYDYMLKNQRPLEGAMSAQAMGPDTSAASAAEQKLLAGGDAAIQADARYASDISAAAGQAGLDQQSGFTRSINDAARQGMRTGASSTKLAAEAVARAGGLASNTAAATNQARMAATEAARGKVGAGRNLRLQDESIGWGRKMDTAGLYRGLSGASQGAYGAAINAGNAATSSQMRPGAALLGGMAQSAGMVQQGMGQKIQGQGAIVNSQTQQYMADQQRQAAEQAGMYQTIGMGAGLML